MKEFIVAIEDNRMIYTTDATIKSELIRCKDCKHHGEQYGNGYCMKDGCYGWYDGDFCSRAERRKDETD